MLKNSARNCRRNLSLIGNVLNNDQFQVFSPGPRIKPVPQFPKKPKAGAVKAAVLNHSAVVLGPEMDCPETQSGRVAKPGFGVPSPGAKTNPLCMTVSPEKVQLPNAVATGPLRFFSSGMFQI